MVQLLGLGQLRIVPDSLNVLVACVKPQIPVSGRLLHFKQEWVKYRPSVWVLRILDVGYIIPFKKLPVFQGVKQTPLKGEYAQVLLEEVNTLLRKGAIELVTDRPQEGYYSSYFLVPKKTGDLRPILNLKPINGIIQKATFKMESDNIPSGVHQNVSSCHGLSQTSINTGPSLSGRYFDCCKVRDFVTPASSSSSECIDGSRLHYKCCKIQSETITGPDLFGGKVSSISKSGFSSGTKSSSFDPVCGKVQGRNVLSCKGLASATRADDIYNSHGFYGSSLCKANSVVCQQQMEIQKTVPTVSNNGNKPGVQ